MTYKEMIQLVKDYLRQSSTCDEGIELELKSDSETILLNRECVTILTLTSSSDNILCKFGPSKFKIQNNPDELSMLLEYGFDIVAQYWNKLSLRSGVFTALYNYLCLKHGLDYSIDVSKDKVGFTCEDYYATLKEADTKGLVLVSSGKSTRVGKDYYKFISEYFLPKQSLKESNEAFMNSPEEPEKSLLQLICFDSIPQLKRFIAQTIENNLGGELDFTAEELSSAIRIEFSNTNFVMTIDYDGITFTMNGVDLSSNEPFINGIDPKFTLMKIVMRYAYLVATVIEDDLSSDYAYALFKAVYKFSKVHKVEGIFISEKDNYYLLAGSGHSELTDIAVGGKSESGSDDSEPTADEVLNKILSVEGITQFFETIGVYCKVFVQGKEFRITFDRIPEFTLILSRKKLEFSYVNNVTKAIKLEPLSVEHFNRVVLAQFYSLGSLINVLRNDNLDALLTFHIYTTHTLGCMLNYYIDQDGVCCRTTDSSVAHSPYQCRYFNNKFYVSAIKGVGASDTTTSPFEASAMFWDKCSIMPDVTPDKSFSCSVQPTSTVEKIKVSAVDYATGKIKTAELDPSRIQHVSFARLVKPHGNCVGVRAITNIGVFDMSLTSAKKVGLTPARVTDIEHLIERNGILVSNYELENKALVPDISNDIRFCQLLAHKALS